MHVLASPCVGGRSLGPNEAHIPRSEARAEKLNYDAYAPSETRFCGPYLFNTRRPLVLVSHHLTNNNNDQ